MGLVFKHEDGRSQSAYEGSVLEQVLQSDPEWTEVVVGGAERSAPDLGGLPRDELEALVTRHGVDLNEIDGSGKNGAVIVADLRDAVAAALAEKE